MDNLIELTDIKLGQVLINKTEILSIEPFKDLTKIIMKKKDREYTINEDFRTVKARITGVLEF